jgi:hypothetical protein
MLFGIKFLIKEIKKLERVIVAVRATHIIKVGYSLLVTANAEQIPKTCKAMGLSLNKGENKTSEVLDILGFLFKA